MKYVYPAVFTTEEDTIQVRFPDFPECITFGTDLADALIMAQDVLCLHLYNLEKKGQPIADVTPINNIDLRGNESASLVACDTLEYQKFYAKQAVKKTVSIPAWLNALAEDANVNFSSVLQQGLKAQLKLN